MYLLDQFIAWIFVYLRPFIKWFLHTFTRLCELQRICYGARPGASRTKQVERSLALSKQPAIKGLIIELDEAVQHCSDAELLLFPGRAVGVVNRIKHIKHRCHPDFAPILGTCVLQIWSYRRLAHIIDEMRAEQYNAENPRHEAKLMELWRLLRPDEELTGRVSKQWQDIGFQGEDPKTDFRGMGLLGLENLLYFAREYKDAAQHVLLHSMHPIFGYTFAIVGINLTSMALRLVKSNDARSHFYNVAHTTKRPVQLAHFHKFYCYLFFEFDRFWIQSEPRNIMDFRDIFCSFEASILEALHSDATIFKTNLVVENI